MKPINSLLGIDNNTNIHGEKKTTITEILDKRSALAIILIFILSQSRSIHPLKPSRIDLHQFPGEIMP